MGNPDSHKMEGLSILEKVENFKKQLELLESNTFINRFQMIWLLCLECIHFSQIEFKDHL